MRKNTFLGLVLLNFLISIYGILDDYTNHHSIIWKILSAVLSLIMLYLIFFKHKEK